MDIVRNTRWTRGALVAVVVGLLLALTGCEKSPKDKLLAARSSIASQQPDEAEQNLKGVLEAQPDNFEAKLLMAEVHMLREEYSKAEEQLQTLWEELELDKPEKELSDEQRQRQKLIEERFSEIYRSWAESIDPKESPDKFEEVARKGLDKDPKSTRLNTMLVDFYEARGEKLVEQGKKLEAAEAFEGILELRTMPKRRDSAEERANNLRWEVAKDEMKSYFEKEAKATLEKEDRYDPEADAVVISVEKDLPRGFNPKNKKQVAVARQAAYAALAGELQKVMVEATGIPKDSNFKVLNRPANLKTLQKNVTEEEASRREYALTAQVPVEQVLKLGFEVKQATRRAAEAKEKAEAEGKADKEGDAKEGDKEAEEGEAKEGKAKAEQK